MAESDRPRATMRALPADSARREPEDGLISAIAESLELQATRGARTRSTLRSRAVSDTLPESPASIGPCEAIKSESGPAARPARAGSPTGERTGFVTLSFLEESTAATAESPPPNGRESR